ncbi:hypothetical protein F7731_08555 [Cytobacillus depressus]|uniref:Uncharacterized protein n=1 Tax=Cytobacillus depressus TaxID=1602942 RepID=A0A6L3V8F5_9BACI|nr:hypothetical protein [Cytobacillus depressus]KAB2337636.1 hypothetical protein F7731_08555 [Cytobacillus depressus]
MTTELNSLLKITLDSEFYPKTTEEINRKIKELEEKVNTLKLKIDIPEDYSKTISKFASVHQKSKAQLNKLYPELDADKFLKVMISTPILTSQLDLQIIMKLISLYNQSRPIQYGESNISATLTVAEHRPNYEQESISIENYIKLFFNQILPIIFFIISQYQSNATTEQLNHMQNQLNQIIEEYEGNKIDEKYEINLPDDFSGGISS